jgi:hypothetical protein
MTELIPTGTIVRYTSHYFEDAYGVVIPREWWAPEMDEDMYVFTRTLRNATWSEGDVISSQKGWWVGEEYTYEVVPEEEIPDEISALAARCLLDREFVPLLSEDNNV